MEELKQIYKKQLTAINKILQQNTSSNHEYRMHKALKNWLKEGLTPEQARERVKKNIEFYEHH